MSSKMKRFLIIALVLYAGILTLNLIFPGIIGQAVTYAKDQLIKVFVNKAPSKVVPKQSGDKMYMPLSFPVEEGEQVWEVKMKYDPKAKTLNVEKVNRNRKLRGDTKCERCNGSGNCQACYPSGSGKNIQGDACPVCDGTGKCMYCNGKGSY